MLLSGMRMKPDLSRLAIKDMVLVFSSSTHLFSTPFPLLSLRFMTILFAALIQSCMLPQSSLSEGV